MNLVFQAEGLSVGEGAFLMACCNHTDAKGYVIAHMQQIADEAHMSLRSARDQRAKLEKRRLLKAGERFSPKNGAQLANLFRVNLDLLASMKRARTDYGPSLVEELTFNEAPEENPSSDPPAKSAAPPSPPPADLAPPPADLAPPPADLAGAGGAKSAPLLLPSSSPSSPAGVPTATVVTPAPEPQGGEREAAAPEVSGADVVVDAYVRALGRPLVNGSRERLRSQAVQLLAAGYPLAWLAARAAEMPANGWLDLVKHAEASRVPLPGQAGPAGADGAGGATPEQVAALRAQVMKGAMM
ncbi:hypothetical protein SAMN04490357_0007 [Streptomyces misionensis]|uniref:Uncharacterized protein n=2 Tax=Streptomyces misionensis TaxID=67331 RepID=A0A1H4I5V9_9ACTN|nr:hypothetical protein SAMN04490357_0007 [Streptomyces misionensis]